MTTYLNIQTKDPQAEEIGYSNTFCGSDRRRHWSPEIVVAMSLEDFAALRERVAEVWPSLHAKHHFGATASNMGCYVAMELGLLERGEWKKLTTIANAMMPECPMASPSWIRVLTHKVRVVAIDGETLKRKKHFKAAVSALTTNQESP